MIVCAVDDLIFSIKISTAAKQLGVDIYFERSRENVLPTIREKQPSLVIFDLNSSRLAPMEAIAAMKADPELRGDPDARLRLARGLGHDRARRGRPASIRCWRARRSRTSSARS